MRLHRMALGAAVAVTLTLTGCGTAEELSGDGFGSGGVDAPATGLQLIVPNAPGGGYDATARTAAQVMEKERITGSVQVSNLPGAGGTVGLQRIVNEEGNGKLALQMGLGVVGAARAQRSKATLAETTPIAKLIEEAGAIVVPKASPYKDVTQLVDAWKKDPRSLAVGGGSSLGGPDHLLPLQLAAAVGIDPKAVSFVSYDGGGELLPALLGNKIAFGASGIGEFLDQVEAGDVRVLAVTSAERVDALEGVPTLKESGIDLVFTNWRGVVAPAGISDADRVVWVDAFTRMHASAAWRAELDRRGWVDAFETGDEFGTFLKEQETEVSALLTTLGLA